MRTPAKNCLVEHYYAHSLSQIRLKFFVWQKVELF